MANFSFNKVILGGRLTATPELKQTPSGVAVTTFSIAVNRKGKEAATDFIDVVGWRQTAEFICKYFKKGSSICIAGSIQTRSWTDNDGQKRYATDVVADEAYFVDGKNDSEQQNTAAPGTYTPDAYKPQQETKFEPIPEGEGLPF